MEMWFSEFHTPDVKHSIRVNRQLYSKQSDYQRIDIFETPEFGRVLTLDGNVMLTERDEFIYDEMITHVPMAIHKEAKDILVIGAGDGGVVRELMESWLISREVLFIPRMRMPCSAVTKELPVLSRSAVFTRLIFLPLLPATGCLALQVKNIILWMTWIRRHGIH